MSCAVKVLTPHGLSLQWSLSLRKLAQEKIFHQDTETNLNSKLKAFQQDMIQINMEREKTENSHKIQIKELEEQSSDMERLLNAAKLESEKLRESCKAFQVQTTTSTEEMIRLKTSLDQDRKTHQDEISALKNKLEMITSLAQEKETTLQQKLDQEQTLHQETENKLSSKIKALELDIMEMSMEREKIGDSHKSEIKELLEHLVNRDKLVYTTQLEKEELKESCKAFEAMTTNLAEEMMGLKSSIQQERKAHQDEMNTLRNKLDMMSIQMQETETTFQQKLVEEEARTAQTNLKFAEYREEIKTVTKERQRYLKNEVSQFSRTNNNDRIVLFHILVSSVAVYLGLTISSSFLFRDFHEHSVLYISNIKSL
ncbi:cingulin-like isoform X1 [Anguilla rostrata]|uniref:cingulin-like isoform X1 n=1 Tax=Anguilla rostrata TaxID=7938 RepID=UPI0030D140EA